MRIAPMALSSVWLYVSCEVDCVAMLTVRFCRPKSEKNFVIGTMTMLS